MFSNESTVLSDTALHKNAQITAQTSAAPPPETVTLDVLKLIERRLNDRRLLSNPQSASFSCLEFLAETERNVFLWRNGHSIGDADHFDFWLNVPALIEKRVKQLRAGGDGENPFLNPLWGVTTFNPANADREVEYLLSFRETYGKVAGHAHALSQIAIVLRNEYSAERGSRPTVVLPSGKQAAARPS